MELINTETLPVENDSKYCCVRFGDASLRGIHHTGAPEDHALSCDGDGHARS